MEKEKENENENNISLNLSNYNKSNLNLKPKQLENKDNIKPLDLNLEKELSKTKIFNKIEDEKKFLSPRKFNFSDENKFTEIEFLFKSIYENINKEQMNHLEKTIENCYLMSIYDDNKEVNVTSIGTVSSLNDLIETTYYSDPNEINQMFSDKSKLEKYIYKYRRIMGDGDCFYRGLIFSFLENIILDNNIMLMKELVILFYQKMNSENPLLNKNELLCEEIKKLNLSIVYQSLIIIINEMEKDNINKSYLILLKLFIYCQEFDSAIIYFTRYLIYEYISENENKIYSKENQIEIGCMLPERFVVDKGEINEYLFQDFYILELMKPKEYAEKIVIYIAPFVFNCDINLLIYNYGQKSFINEKKFSCKKKIIYQLNLLYRIIHYDVYYKKDFYDKYSKYLDSLLNIYEDIHFLSYNNSEEAKKKYFENILNKNNKDNLNDINSLNKNNDENKNKCDNSDEKNENKLNQNNNDNNNLNSNDNIKINNSKDVNDINNKKNKEIPYNNKEINKLDNNLYTCMECKKSYNHKDNIFYLCNECLINILKSQILLEYLSYLEKYKKTYTNKFILNSYFSEKKITISYYKDIPILKAINNTDHNFNELFLEVRKNLCLFCANNIEYDNFYIELPCKCRICSERCLLGYIDKVKEQNKEINQEGVKYKPMSYCPCGFKFNLNSIIYMIKEIEKNNLNNFIQIYKDLIKIFWDWKCMYCGENYNKNNFYFKITFNDDKINKKYIGDIDFEHLVCTRCDEFYQVKNGITLNCEFCGSEHKNIKMKNL